jgi:histidine triad (HIT) family protein
MPFCRKGRNAMSLDGAYDADNIFAKIVRGDMPAAKVFEDHDTLAFMDVFPQAKGHTLVIHKQAAARNLLEIEPEPLQTLILTVQRVTRAVRAALNPDAVMVSQFNGAASGQTIYHLHFHIIPRWQGVPLGRHGGGGMADIAELNDLAHQIASQIA